MVYIQRSRGYELRPSLSVDEIGKVCEIVKKKNPNVIVMVDNCYGEFVEMQEPTQVGADLIAGSMIKNAGGGIATTGGYIAGREDLVEKCAYRLTTPGLGREVGATIGMNRELYMGLFYAPHTVGEALKSAVYISALYESFGYDVTPKYNETRHDIVQSLGLENAESLVDFARGFKAAALLIAIYHLNRGICRDMIAKLLWQPERLHSVHQLNFQQMLLSGRRIMLGFRADLTFTVQSSVRF